MKHFMAVMGTGLYEPVVYKDGEFTSSEQEFIQLALIEKYREDLQKEGSKITLFVTKDADSKNMRDRNYFSYEETTANNRWISEKKQFVKEGEPKKGFLSLFKEQFPELLEKLNPVAIKDPLTEEGIWQVFNTIFNEIKEEDEIIFDITHSLRSIPMLAITVINYAKVLKKCSLESICYGAYEASEDVDGKRVAPINDLTMYDEILSWTNAANVFMKYGNAAMMKELFDKKQSKFHEGKQNEWKEVGMLVGSMTSLSDAIQTGRGADGDLLDEKILQKGVSIYDVSVKSGYRRFAELSTEEIESKAREMQPLYHLFNEAKERFSVFDQEQNYEVGMQLTEWAIDNEMIQQGYTALEETIKTFLCHLYGISEIEKKCREEVINKCINIYHRGICQASKDKKNHEKTDDEKVIMNTSEGRLSYLRSQLNDNRQIDKSAFDQYADVVEKIFTDDNTVIVQLSNNVSQDRNDINHFGMRTNPKAAKTLRENLKKYCNRFKEIVEKYEGNSNPEN